MNDKRRARISETWRAWRNGRFLKFVCVSLPVYTVQQRLDLTNVYGDMPTDAAVETVTFTTEDLGYKHEGVVYEWYNVMCEGKAVDWWFTL